MTDPDRDSLVDGPEFVDGTASTPPERSDPALPEGDSESATSTPAEPAGPTAHVERESVEVRYRRAPRYGVLMALGGLVGLAGGWIAGALGTPDPDLGRVPMTVFLIVLGVVVGIALGGLVAIVLDRVFSRRATLGTAERTRRVVDDVE